MQDTFNQFLSDNNIYQITPRYYIVDSANKMQSLFYTEKGLRKMDNHSLYMCYKDHSKGKEWTSKEDAISLLLEVKLEDVIREQYEDCSFSDFEHTTFISVGGRWNNIKVLFTDDVVNETLKKQLEIHIKSHWIDNTPLSQRKANRRRIVKEFDGFYKVNIQL